MIPIFLPLKSVSLGKRISYDHLIHFTGNYFTCIAPKKYLAILDFDGSLGDDGELEKPALAAIGVKVNRICLKLKEFFAAMYVYNIA